MGTEIFIFIYIGVHLLTSIPFYIYAKKAEYDNSFFAFIPIVNYILILNLAGFSWGYIFIYLIPIVNIFFGVYVYFRFFSSFENGMVVIIVGGICTVIGIFVPYITIIIIIVMYGHSLSDNRYVGYLA